MSSPLTLTLIDLPEYEIDMSALLPEKLEGLSQKDIKLIKLVSGNKKIPVSSLFRVTGRFDGESLTITGHKKLNAIGKDMSRGSISVEGNAGECLGQNMSGGKISVHGHAGSWVGTGMRGGTINIKGNVGDFLGAGKASQKQGMNGGLIAVGGHAGDRAGDRMRRGTIVIGKNCGDYCGSRMVAGSIVCFGEAGQYPGYAMKRGTIILTAEPAHLSATFRSCGDLELAYLRLLFKQFAQMGQPLSRLNRYSPVAHRFAGDLANSGQGEILLIKQK